MSQTHNGMKMANNEGRKKKVPSKAYKLWFFILFYYSFKFFVYIFVHKALNLIFAIKLGALPNLKNHNESLFLVAHIIICPFSH